MLTSLLDRQNPDFYDANQASLSTCDFSFGLGDARRTGSEFGLPPPADKTVMTFAGPQILAASLKKLGALGLSKATSVLLTGTAGGGVQVFLQADAVAAALKTIAPNLKVFKALAVDGLRPRLRQTMFCTASVMGTNCCAKADFLKPACYNGSTSHIIPSWMDTAYQSVLNVSKALPNIAKGCAAKHQGKEWLCLYGELLLLLLLLVALLLLVLLLTPFPTPANETLPFVKTPVFAVNQLLSTWDAQCMEEGQNSGNILQVTPSRSSACSHPCLPPCSPLYSLPY